MRIYPLLIFIVAVTTNCTEKSDVSLAPKSMELKKQSTPIDRVTMRKEVKITSAPEAIFDSPVENQVIGTSANGKLKVTILPLQIQEKLNACACTFSPNGAGSALIAGWLDPSEGAWMQINGITQNFTIDDERNQRKAGKNARPEVGDKTTYNLSNLNYKSDIACKISSTCWESSECESVSYNCAVTVRSIDATVTVPATGICGC